MELRSILPSTWQLPDVIRKRFGDSVGRQRPMLEEEHLLLALHAPPSGDDDEREGRFFWRHPDGTWHSSEGNTGIHTLRSLVDEYAEQIEGFDQMEAGAVQAEAYYVVMEGLTPLSRAANNMHTVLQEARQLVPEDRELISVRDYAYQIARRAELLLTHTKNGLDYAIAHRVEQQAQATYQMSVAAHRLNLLAAFFFPIATLSAVLGSNLRHGLEDATPPLAFLAMCAVGLVSGLMLTWFVTSNRDAA